MRRYQSSKDKCYSLALFSIHWMFISIGFFLYSDYEMCWLDWKYPINDRFSSYENHWFSVNEKIQLKRNFRTFLLNRIYKYYKSLLLNNKHLFTKSQIWKKISPRLALSFSIETSQNIGLHRTLMMIYAICVKGMRFKSGSFLNILTYQRENPQESFLLSFYNIKTNDKIVNDFKIKY